MCSKLKRKKNKEDEKLCRNLLAKRRKKKAFQKIKEKESCAFGMGSGGGALRWISFKVEAEVAIERGDLEIESEWFGRKTWGGVYILSGTWG